MNTSPRQQIVRKLFGYFFRGLLFVVPIAATLYVIYYSFMLVDRILPFDMPGLGFLVIISGITLLGYLSSFYFANPVISLLEQLMEKTPLLKIIYTSIKDLLSAFVGEKKRFTHPVLVTVNKDSNLQKLGFITQEDLTHFGIRERVAVYLPHSYNFSGNLFIIPKENITPVDASGTEVMKFIVSGGVSEL